jgi:hypothetical protein
MALEHVEPFTIFTPNIGWIPHISHVGDLVTEVSHREVREDLQEDLN